MRQHKEQTIYYPLCTWFDDECCINGEAFTGLPQFITGKKVA